ncbi:thiolase family protein [Ramlibacter sp.]|uniref:thiolase family protein n=1 Tax=Ramlibacter sp. TaxID=1917967 RepID=UPI003D1275C7
MRDAVAVTGIGETVYQKKSLGKTALQLQLEASLAAISDAGLKPTDIDGLITYAGANSPVIPEDFIVNFGLDLRFSGHTPLGGASPVAAIQSAAAMIFAGVCRHVLIPVGRSNYTGARASDRIKGSSQLRLITEFERPAGAFAPAQYYAQFARRHMELYGTTSRQLAEIAVTTRRHAALNGNAAMTAPMTIEDHQASRMITDPFRLFDCSLETDGGAAIVVSATERARDMRQKPVIVMGVAEGHPDSPSTITQRENLTEFGTARAAPHAFAMAGVTPKDIDVAEIYDCFTFVVLNQLENLGFCRKGEGGAFVENGNIGLGGTLPVNTHGGLLSQGHVLGMNHVVELVKQLRGEAGKAQVKDAEIGLVSGFGNMCEGSVAIMRRA